MARVPGTERPSNRAGWVPGARVRCRRSRANAERGLPDARGFVVEVRPGHARVLLAPSGHSAWIESEALLPTEHLEDDQLETLREVFARLGGQRLEVEEEDGACVFVVLGEGYEVSALDRVRALLGDHLVGLSVAPQGVHELATRLVLSRRA